MNGRDNNRHTGQTSCNASIEIRPGSVRLENRHSLPRKYIVPSLDLVIYKLGGKDGQYDHALTGLPQPEQKHDRENWQPPSRTAFDEGSSNGDSTWRVLEMVCGAVRE